MQLDFSQFHPLDHFPGTRRCRSLPGGTRNHLALDWQYRRMHALRAVTLCKVGRHSWVGGWVCSEDIDLRDRRKRPPDFVTCRSCGRDQ